MVEVGGYSFAVRYHDLNGSMSHVGGDDRVLLESIFKETQESYLLLRVPVGSVSIALNRESIKFDEDTVNELLRVSKIVAKEMAKTTQKQFDDIKHLWEAKKKFGELENNGLHGLWRSIKNKLTWKGKPIDGYYYTLKPVEDYVVSDNFSFTRRRSGNGTDLPKNVRLPKTSYGPADTIHVHPRNDYTIVIVDNYETISRKLRAQFKQNQYVMFLLEPKVLPVGVDWWQPALDKLDCPPSIPVLKMSEIVPLPPEPKKPRVATPGNTVIKNKFFKTQKGTYMNFEPVDIDLASKKVEVWIPYHNNDVDDGETVTRQDGTKHTWQCWRDLGTGSKPKFHGNPTQHTLKTVLGDDFRVIGVPRGQRKYVPAHWVHICDYVRSIVAPESEWARIVKLVGLPAVDPSHMALARTVEPHLKKAGKAANSPLLELVKKINDFDIEIEAAKKSKAVMDVFKLTIDATAVSAVKVPDYKSELEQMVEKVPALSILTKCNLSALRPEDWQFLVASV